jgi:hypothetical protein
MRRVARPCYWALVKSLREKWMGEQFPKFMGFITERVKGDGFLVGDQPTIAARPPMYTLHTPMYSLCTPYVPPVYLVFIPYSPPINTLCNPDITPIYPLYTPYVHPDIVPSSERGAH